MIFPIVMYRCQNWTIGSLEKTLMLGNNEGKAQEGGRG